MTFECKGYNPIDANVEEVKAIVPDFPDYDPDIDEIPSGEWFGILNTNATVIETYGNHLKVLDNDQVRLYSDGTSDDAILVFITNNDTINCYGYLAGLISSSYWVFDTMPYGLKKTKEEVE